jgi:uncharacterized membrane protein YfcA
MQWLLLVAGAFVTGLSKGGIAGLGILAVACFANALPARESTGALLPLLIAADVFGVAFYRKHADWPKLWRLFPWVAGGVVLGCLALGRVNNTQISRLIGAVLLLMVVLHLWRQRQVQQGSNSFGARLPHAWWFVGLIGMLAGFTTMVANAAGPVMVLFLLAAGLPKLEFLGTMAWFFLVVNCFKVPFSAVLGLINVDSLSLDAWLLVAMVPGALLGPVIVKRINQRAFEWLALALTVVAAGRLLR